LNRRRWPRNPPRVDTDARGPTRHMQARASHQILRGSRGPPRTRAVVLRCLPRALRQRGKARTSARAEEQNRSPKFLFLAISPNAIKHFTALDTRLKAPNANGLVIHSAAAYTSLESKCNARK
jgi:hypothetical protein